VTRRPSDRSIAGARRALLAWYGRNARDLPWRLTRDPYAIWVSEVMLQQTRVDTVRGRWERFLARFPDVRALARASEQAVLKEWEGLGYYGRARRLRQAARAIVEDHGGTLPADPGTLRRLPGFGPYTAAAVASIAFGEPAAVLDGNVVRVLSRWCGERRRVEGGPGRRRLAALADRLLDPDRPGDANQALMEVGATVCTPRSPRCPACPLRPGCVARGTGDPECFPRAKAPRRIPHHDVAAGVVWRGGRVLVCRRRPEGLLGGLWEFPGGKREPGETLEAACMREIREETGLRVAVTSPFLSIDHAYTHFRITLHLFHCEAPRGRPRALGCEEARFVSLAALADLPFPRANRRAIERLDAR
jgi:A/G-specific adenine glycosylase